MTSTTSNLPGILSQPSSELLTNWYAEQVVQGHILASHKVMLAGKRHLDDLKRQGSKDFPYVFDEEKGHRPIVFIERFCKPSKGKFKQMIMQPWQHFILGNLYGWVHKETGLRRFTEGLIFIARKNGKSGLASGISIYGCTKDGERGADVYVLANSMKQVRKTIFDECKKMIKASPQLKKKMKALRDVIEYKQTNSIIEPQASDSEKLDGLNTHLAVFDEIHEYKNYDLINIIKNSTDTREQPLLLYITTAGYQLDGPLVDYYELGADVLEGVVSDERTFYYMAELDSEEEIDNPDMWGKANPNLGVTYDLEKLKNAWEKRKNIPAERSDMIVKRFNIFVKADEMSFIDFNTLRKNNKHLDIDSLNGKTAIGSFDLSESEDFTSACLEFPLDTGEIFVLSHSWIPRKKVLANNEKIPYMQFVEDGSLTVCEAEYVEYEMIYDWFVNHSKTFSIEKIAYDRAKAFRLVKALESYGFQTEIVRQGAETLTKPLSDLKEMFYDGKVITNENKLLRWYINNVKLTQDRNRNWHPTKQNRYRKIDGFAALLNAHVFVMEKLVAPKGNGNIEFLSVGDLFH
ncbi:terminase large subunit [Paenibacillus phage Norbert]|nr:terminase large subunit [Paenibacillus larvae]YP_009197947.1 terminase large subunit [Paenibacillus phage Diva]YP_009201912.1 terminase large subunit [Paenibacillus phage Xenia]YP_009203204.1 terminase large subunit [Paenibacillus phage Fern]YP_009203447.1 terminase large subunit [Paenibacillus phage Sitara]YP_009224868.1 terminase large subunit [Paenibacillus phage Rani]YP_009593411.1 terminase large subunit [Paenibacillus phage Willow]YP_009598525.1 terminase large subunit [Paenibacillu